MPDDREIARRSLDLQARGKEFALVDIPAYREWSSRKLKQGESEAFIAHLDAMSMWMLPEEVASVGESLFEELLAEVKEAVGKLESDFLQKR